VSGANALHFLIPGDLQTPTGGYGYDRRIIAGLRDLGWRIEVHALKEGFPHPTAAALDAAHRTFAQLPDGALVLVDGLALGALPGIAHAHAARLRLVALVHHPLAAENGLDAALARELARSESRALEAVRHVVVTSGATKLALHAFGVEPPRISVVEPGTDPAPMARRARGPVLQLLCVAALIPRKGHELLFTALAALESRDWHLTCIGSLTRDPATAARLCAQVERSGLQERVTFTGEVDAAQLRQAYCGADLFVLPTRFEGYGMAVAEALAHGVPVIGTRVGAIADLVGCQAGRLVEPGDAAGLLRALSGAMTDPAVLDGLAAGAAAVRGTLPDWPQACGRMSRTLAALDQHPA